MSCVDVADGFSVKTVDRKSNWFHNSLQHLQQWPGWNHFKQRSHVKYQSGASLADGATWCATRNTTNAANAAASSTLIRRRISEDSLDFFDKFATIRQRAERPRRGLSGLDFNQSGNHGLQSSIRRSLEPNCQLSETVEVDGVVPQPAPRSRPRSRISLTRSSSTALIWDHELLVGKEVEDVYVELVYSLIHAISRSDRLPSIVQDVFVYLQSAFQISSERHQQCLSTVRQRKPPDFSLQLGILQARHLKGKDVNGLSDPYCSVWISSSRQKLVNTTMKPRTLDPVWNETLQFSIKDTSEDHLQIEVWDFDPNETLKEKLCRLGEVKDCRGLGKLLKQMAVATAKTTPGKQPHQFLGRLDIPLKMVPVMGLERWFSLEGRQDKTKVKERGEIKLNLMMSATSIDVQFTFKENIAQYQQILRVFIEHHLRSDAEWRGHMNDLASLSLRQFAAHRGLRASVTDVCLWSTYTSTLMRRTLDYALLRSLLQRIRKSGIDSVDQLNQLDAVGDIFWTAAQVFITAALTSIRHIRNNVQLRSNPAHLAALLQCVNELEAMGHEMGRSNFANLRKQITDAITMGAADCWCQVVGRRKVGGPICDDDRLENAIRICQSLMEDLKTQLTLHNDVFIRELEIASFSVVYQYYDSQLSTMCKPTIESVTRSLKSNQTTEEDVISLAMEASGAAARSHKTPATQDIYDTSATDDLLQTPKLTMGTALFELYLCLQQFQKLSAAVASADKEKLKLNCFYVWFATAVCRWLDIALFKAMIRIGKAIALDSLQPVDSLVKFSSSAVDTVTVFYQIKTFWEQLAWPDTEGALTFVIKIIDDVNRCSSFYADALSCKLERLHETPSTEVFYITQPVCAAVHSILHVRKSVEPLAEEMGLSSLCRALQENNNEAGLVSAKAKETLQQNAIDNIDAKLDEIFYTIARKIEAEVGKLMPTVSETGFNSNHSLKWKRLVSYIDHHLITLNTQLDTVTFDRVLHLIHQRILATFYAAVSIDIEKKKNPGVFQQWSELLKIINECFYGPLSEEQLCDELLAKIKLLLKLHGSESDRLIHQYQLERMGVASQDSALGSITVRAVFVNDTLTLDILNCRNLKATDSGGSADPYFKVQLMPADKFLDAVVYKSKVHKNTLFPLFDETFSSAVRRELQTCNDCFVLLTVKDRDLLYTSELLGEAFLSLHRIPRADSVSAIKDFDQIHLHLSKPTNKESECLHILESRSWDKVAKDFAKRERRRMNGK